LSRNSWSADNAASAPVERAGDVVDALEHDNVLA
jgi:hypothetical protein